VANATNFITVPLLTPSWQCFHLLSRPIRIIIIFSPGRNTATTIPALHTASTSLAYEKEVEEMGKLLSVVIKKFEAMEAKNGAMQVMIDVLTS
jgi:hypothetical protein